MTRRFNYRHFIYIFITLGFIACSVFVFPNALGRIIEGGRDLGLSVAFYFCEMFGIEYGFTPTVIELPKFPFFPSYSGDSPTTTLPETFTGFKSNFVLYWQLWINEDNFFGYLSVVGNVLYKVALIVTVLIPFINCHSGFQAVFKAPKQRLQYRQQAVESVQENRSLHVSTCKIMVK